MSRRLHRCGFWIPQIGSLVLVWSVLAAVAPAGANSVVPVEVKRVVDGDTIEVLLSGKREKVRLLSVDAPESDQEFGKEARNALREFAEGKTGVLRLANNRDQYNRLLGSLAIEGQDAGLYLIENGYAWFFKAYGGSVPQEWRTAYEMAQANAKYESYGLWTAVGPVPPWVWRKQKRMEERDEWSAYGETLEGATEELQIAWQKVERAFFKVDSEGHVVPSELEFKQEDGNSNAQDGPRKPDADSLIEEKEPLPWWRLFVKLGESLSHWISVLIRTLF